MTLFRTTVKAVTLDADDTLWNFDEGMRAGLAQVLGEIRRLAPTGSCPAWSKAWPATSGNCPGTILQRAPL